jgi:hypothetical protein
MAESKQGIRQAQTGAILAVNQALLALYRGFGQLIEARQKMNVSACLYWRGPALVVDRHIRE